MNKVKFLDLLPSIYYSSWIQIEILDRDYGSRTIYNGTGGRVFEQLNINFFSNYVVRDISNGLDGGSPMTIFRLEEI